MKGLGDIVKQAQQLQERMQQIQQEAGSKVVEASAGGGMVTARVNGRLEIVDLKIDPTVIDAKDADMLRDLIMAAVNEGVRRAQQMVAEEMSKLTGGLNLKIPGLG
jgi:DNA-binding YbaB/EbfC family protein